MELEGQVALVTGGSRGIGRAVAKSLAEAGAKVVISYNANEEAAMATLAELKSGGRHATAVRFDVGDSEATKSAIEGITKELGGLSILVSNAGIAVDGLLLRVKDEDLDRLFKTNVFGAFYCARAAARSMVKARYGRIIFMGSVVGEMGNVGQSAYSASKASLEGLAKSLARELASRNVTVNVVAPGFIATDMTADMTEEMKKILCDSIPLQRVGTPDEVADAVLFLASLRARYITGQVLGVNGGLYM